MDSVKVTCSNCRQEVRVIMYFNNARILVRENVHAPEEKWYEATCYGDALCPLCGGTIHKSYSGSIYREDIIKFAVGEDNDSN